MVGFTNGITIKNKKYYDGALLDNTPIAPILSSSLDLIIVVQFDDYVPNIKPPLSNCPIVFFSFQEDNSLLHTSLCFDQSSISRMIDKGFNRSNNLLSLLESKYEDKFSFREYIHEINSHLIHGENNGDKMIRMLNRLSKIIR